MGLAPATVRRHLDILQRDRLVAFAEVKKRTGRPEHSFYLTERGQEVLPKKYDQLLGMLVEEISGLAVQDTDGIDGQGLLELVFRRLSERVAGGYREQLADKDLSSRLGVLVDQLARDDFYPEAEVVEGTLRIRLLNCPFRSVAMQNKAVCSFDLNLISNMLDLDVEREECISDGDGGCMYSAAVGAESERALAFLGSS